MASTWAFGFLATVLFLMRLLKTDGTTNVDSFVATKPVIYALEGKGVTLPCKYDREVFVVYWYRGVSSSVDSLIMYLDVFYGGGERGFGPQSAAGRYNMTDNFSLIIYDVSVEDEGRYLCEVSDRMDGTVYRNTSTLTVIGTLETMVNVTPELELIIGLPGVVPCSYQRPVSAVTWYSGKLPSPENVLGKLRFDPRPAQTTTWHIASDRFNITEEFGLQIKMVDEEDEGYYTCQVNDVALNMYFYNNSKVAVKGFMAGTSPAYIAVPLVIITMLIGIICIVVCILQKRKGEQARTTSAEETNEEALCMVERDAAVTASGVDTNEHASDSLVDDREVSNLRNTISKYKSASISIQLGGEKVLKWTFMSSVFSSLTEKGGSCHVDQDENKFLRKPIKLSPYIELREHQVRQSGSFRRLSKTERKIQLIFIASYRRIRGIAEIRNSIQDFSKKIRYVADGSMKLVIIPDEFGDNLDDVKRRISSQIDVHINNIYVVNCHRYKKNKKPNVKTSISFLKIIKDCLS